MIPPASAQQAVLAALAAGPLTSRGIYAALAAWRTSTVCNAIYALTSGGKIVRSGAGRGAELSLAPVRDLAAEAAAEAGRRTQLGLANRALSAALSRAEREIATLKEDNRRLRAVLTESGNGRLVPTDRRGRH